MSEELVANFKSICTVLSKRANRTKEFADWEEEVEYGCYAIMLDNEISFVRYMNGRERRFRLIVRKIHGTVDFIASIEKYCKQNNLWKLRSHEACVFYLGLREAAFSSPLSSISQESIDSAVDSFKTCLEIPATGEISLLAPIYGFAMNTKAMQLGSIEVRKSTLLDQCRLGDSCWEPPIESDSEDDLFQPQETIRASWKTDIKRNQSSVAEIVVPSSSALSDKKGDLKVEEIDRILVDARSEFRKVNHALRTFKVGTCFSHPIHMIIRSLAADTSFEVDDIRPNSKCREEDIFPTFPEESNQDFLDYWKKVAHTIEMASSFNQALRRYDQSLIVEDLEDRFAYLILALESLIPGSMADKQYRIPFLLSADPSTKLNIYKFMGISYKIRNDIVHGGSAFGRSFFNDLAKEFPKATGTKKTKDKIREWYIQKLSEIVVSCIRYFAQLKIYSDKNRNKIGNMLSEIGLGKKAYSDLVHNVPPWMDVGSLFEDLM